MRRLLLPACLALVSVTALAACGDDGSGVRSGSGSGSGSGSASASASASASGSGSGVAGDAAFDEADADSVIHVSATEYAFSVKEPKIVGPNVYFEVSNDGKENHEFEILDADGDTVDEIPEFEPGETKSLAVKLEPGTYTIQCILETSEGKTHASLGMTMRTTVSSS